MAEHNPIYTAAATADTIQYKPLSLFAVAGFSVSILFALLVLAFAVDGLLRGQPFFLPALLILLPLAGAALSGLGLWEVRTSEGTRAGAKLATWGLALSLVVGICYYVYQHVTGLAIIQQANRFLMEKEADSGFFPRLQGGKIDLRIAYLLTLPPNERTVRPDNDGEMEKLDMPNPQAGKGPVSRFMDSYLVRIIREGRPNVTIEPGAVKDWTYESGTYKVFRTYRITTDDGSWDVALAMVSSEPEAEGDKRKWRVEWYQVAPLQAVSRTEQGRKKLALRREAYKFLMNQETGLFANLTQRRGFEVYLAQQQPQDRKELRVRKEALEARTPLIAVAGSVVPPLDLEQEENLRMAFLPQYTPLGKFAESLDMSSLRFVDPNDVNAIRSAAEEAFSLSKLPSLAWGAQEDELASYEVRGGEVVIKIPFEVAIVIEKKMPNSEKKMPLNLKVLGNVVVAAPSTLDPNSKNADREWRIERIELFRALPVLNRGPTSTNP